MFKHLKYFVDLNKKNQDEYLGNIWGWKVSFIGLGLVVFLLALYAYRITYHPQPLPSKDSTEISK